MSTTTKTYLMLIFASVAWGFQPVCIKWLLAEWSPVTMTAIRYLIISAVLFLVVYPKEKGHFLPDRSLWGWLAVMGILSVLLNNVLQFTGLRETTVINCTLISATSPAITAFMAVFLIHERLHVFSWAGIFISFAGVLVVVSNGSWEVIRSIDFHRGDMLCFASQMCWAVFSFMGLKIMRRMSVLSTTLWTGLFGGVETIIYGLIIDDFHAPMLSTLPLLSFFYLVVIGGLLSLYFYNAGVKNAGPSITAIFLNIMPVVGMLSGFLVLSEPIGFVQLGGAAAIFAGVYLTTHGERIANTVGRN